MINGSTKLVRGLMLAIALAALAAPARAQTLLAKPYVQPAPAAPAPGDAKLIAWVTDQTPGEFAVEYEWPGQVARAAPVRRVAIDLPEYRPEPKKAVAPAAADTKGDDDDDHEPAPPPTVTPAQHYFKYTAALDGLPPDAAVTYRVRLAGAPLMATIPFHALLGNHDVDTSLNVFPDALGIYYFFHAPVNGPGPGKWNTPTGRDKAQAAAFRAAAGDSYPALAFHSFDNGPAHFLVLDNSGYVKLDAPEILRWIEADLTASQTRWKFVCLHAPAFHSSPAHYSEQKTRLLVPLLEKLGVDVVFAGHVHNYQRSHPLRFEPAPRKPGEKLVSGKFTLDTTFDGKANTRPNGIVHIVSGGGGGTLYRDPTGDKAAKFMTEKYGPANWVPYTAVHVADRHSFVACDLSPDRLVLRAIDADGKVIDNIVITK
ncbi:MAG TPA: metallophosphoesterase [Tepidisphaeraceae bacterium]|nr:metallophosphoesterase [Tepidisphaeraceae bacterium]